MSNSTQNDWEKRFSKRFTDNILKDGYGNDLITKEATLIMDFIRKELADARKKVFTKKEREYLVALLMIIQTEIEADRALGMRVNKEEEDMNNKVLATLKEEGV